MMAMREEREIDQLGHEPSQRCRCSTQAEQSCMTNSAAEAQQGTAANYTVIDPRMEIFTSPVVGTVCKSSDPAVVR